MSATATETPPTLTAAVLPRRHDALPAPEFLRGMIHVEEHGPPRFVAQTCMLVAFIVAVAVVAAFLIRLEVLSTSPGQLQPLGSARPLQYLDHGYLTELLVEEGKTVKAGEVIARLRVPKLDDDLQEALSRQRSLRSRVDLRLAFFAQSGRTGERDGMLGLWNDPTEIFAVEQHAPPLPAPEAGPETDSSPHSPTVDRQGLERSLEVAIGRQQLLSRLWERQLVDEAEVVEANEVVSKLRQQLGRLDVAGLDGLESWARTDSVLALRRGQLEANLGILADQRATAQQTQDIYRYQRQRIDTQLQLAMRNVDSLARLRDKRLVSETELISAQRDLIELQLAHDRLEASVLEGQGQIQELDARRLELDSKFKSEQLTELESILSELQQIEARIDSLTQDRLRTELRAPIDGTIHKIAKRDIGSIVEAGEVLAELVPSKEPIIAELMVNPSDIPHIAAGLSAKISIEGLDPYRYGYVLGKVDYIAPFSRQLEDGTPYFTVRIRLDERTDMGKAVQSFVRPGLKVRGMIVIGERTLVEYLVRPVAKVFENSFHEY